MTDDRQIDAIERKPVQTPYIRRNSVHNPEFLDPDRLLVRFAPLIESVLQKLKPWYGRYNNTQDTEDLRSLIQMEFLRLHDRFDPSYGVDFPGYIKLNLERRVRYHVTRRYEKDEREVLAFGSSITNNYMESMPDHRATRDLRRVERIASIPLDKCANEMYRDIIDQIVNKGADICALAERYHTTPRSMAVKVDAAGEYARTIMMEQDSGQEEKCAGTEDGTEPADDCAGEVGA